MNRHPLASAALLTPTLRRRAVMGPGLRLAIAASCMLAGCAGSLLSKPTPPPARYLLDQGVPVSAPTARLAVNAPSLKVDVPLAAPGYDSRKMLYVRRPGELDAFAFHEWVEAPAEMLAPLLVRALDNSAGFGAVLLAPTAAAASWRLETHSLRLHQDFTTQPSQVRLSLRAVLVDSASRTPLAWRELNVNVATRSDDPVAGAASAQAATQQLLAALAQFCAEQVTARGR